MRTNKSGFTLVELMAVLAILSLFLIMTGGVFIQGYKILNRTNNYSAIEDEFRTAILNIEKSIQADFTNNVVIYKDKKNIYLNNSEYPRDKQQMLMCIIPEDSSKEKIMYIQADNISGNSQLIEVNFTDADNEKFLEKENGNGHKVEILDSNPKVLISKIDTNNGGINFEENNGMINVSIPGIKKGNDVRVNAYSGSIAMVEDSTIEINVNSNGGSVGNPEPPSPPTTDAIIPNDPTIDSIIDIIGDNVFSVLGNSKKSLIDINTNANGSIKLNENNIFYLQPLENKIIKADYSDIYGNKIELGNSKNDKNIWENNYLNKNIKIPNVKGLKKVNECSLNYSEIEKINGVKFINDDGTFTDNKDVNTTVGIVAKIEDIYFILVNGSIKLNKDLPSEHNIENIILYTPNNIIINGGGSNINIKASFICGGKITWNSGANVGSIYKINLNENKKAAIKDIIKAYSEELGISIKSEIVTDWGSTSHWRISIKNNTASNIRNWQVAFKSNVRIIECWNGEIIDLNNRKYAVSNKEYNSTILSGTTLVVEGVCDSGKFSLDDITVYYE